MTDANSRPTPFYSQIREQLRQQIASGFYSPGMRLPSEAELLKSHKASNTTVIRAMNDLVREGLIVRRRGSGTYVVDREQPPLIPGRPLKLGILWCQSVAFNLANPFCERITLGALKVWRVSESRPESEQDRARTYTRLVWREPARGLTVECLGNEWGGLNRAPSLDVVRKAGYDAIMTVGIIEENWLSSLLDLGIPTVIVDFPTQRLGERADVVYADPQTGYRAAVDRFIERGLRRIHFVGATTSDPNNRIPDSTQVDGFRFGKRIDPDTFLRKSAYHQAMDAHGINVPDDWVHYQTSEDKLLGRCLAALDESQRPQAFICHDHDRAERLIHACAELGLRVEGAGATMEPHVSPALNICLDVTEMGSVAGELMLTRLKHPARPYLNVGVRMNLIQEVVVNQAAVQIASQHVSTSDPIR